MLKMIHYKLFSKTLRYNITRIFAIFSKLIPNNSELTIVSGANDDFFESLCYNLLESIKQHETAKVIVWDLGLCEKNLNYLLQSYPHVKLMKFEFSKYPDYFSLKSQSYGFKSVCIWESIKISETKYLFWLDAGCKLTGRLNAVRYLLNIYGFYSPFSSTTTGELTYKSVLDHFENGHLEIGNKKMLNGACVAINVFNPKSFSIIREWYDLTFNKELLIPKGSNRENHRQDQSLLTLIYYSRYDTVPLLCGRTYKFKLHCNKNLI